MAYENYKRKRASLISADIEGGSFLLDQFGERTIRMLKIFCTVLTDLIFLHLGIDYKAVSHKAIKL